MTGEKILVYLCSNEATRKHHLNFGAKELRFLSRRLRGDEDPVNTVSLHEDDRVCQGEWQMEASVDRDAGDVRGFNDQGKHLHAGQHVTSQYHDGQLPATSFDKTILAWSGRNTAVSFCRSLSSVFYSLRVQKYYTGVVGNVQHVLRSLTQSISQ